MRRFVKGRSNDLRGLERNVRGGIGEGSGRRKLTGIIVIEGEMGAATMLAMLITLAARLVARACALGFGDDARSRCPLPREVSDRRACMIVRKGNVDQMVGWVNGDLEKIGQAAVRATQ